MKKEQNSFIGLEVSFNESDYNTSIKDHETVCKKLNAVIEEYKYLNREEPVTTELLQDLIKNRTRNLTSKLFEEIENSPISKQLPVSVVEGWKLSATKGLENLEARLQDVSIYINSVSIGPLSRKFFKEAITVDSGFAVLNEEGKKMIRNHYKVTIETERQAKLYQLFISLKKNFDAFAEYVRRDLGLTYPIFDKDYMGAICNLSESGAIELDPYIFKNFE